MPVCLSNCSYPAVWEKRGRIIDSYQQWIHMLILVVLKLVPTKQQEEVQLNL